MKNHKTLKMAAALCAVLVSGGAAAAEPLYVDLNVFAQVHDELTLRLADGTLMPSTLELGYKPGVGMDETTLMTSIYTNNMSRGVDVTLARELVLQNVTGAGRVEMNVAYGSKPLVAGAPAVFTATELFAAGDASPGKSRDLALVIAQKVLAPITNAGRYEGTVSLTMVQNTSSL